MTARLDATWLMLPAGLLLAASVGLLAGAEPTLAIAVALAVAFLLIALHSLSAGLVFFTLLAFLELVPAGPALSVVRLAGAILAISWLATVTGSASERREFPSAHPALFTLLFLFAAWSALSFLWASSPSTAFNSATSFILNFALFPIVYTAVRGTTDVRRVAGAFIAGAVLAAAYGILVQPDATAFATGSSGGSGVDRLSGTLGDPNELAALLVAGMALATMFLFDRASSPLLRAAALAGAGVLLLTLLVTVSRGGLVALGAALVVTVLVARRYRGWALATVLAVAATALVFFLSFASPAARERITASDGGGKRTDVWKVAGRMVDDHPVTGVGAGNFRHESIHYLVEPGTIRFDELIDERSVTHNAYLEVLTGTGFVGLSLYVAIIAACVASMLRAARNFGRRGDLRGELTARAVIVAVAATLAAYFFLSEESSKYLWLLLSLGPALLAISQQGEPDTA
jgi:putative inorganic carbon (HCO3(-)) transporter